MLAQPKKDKKEDVQELEVEEEEQKPRIPGVQEGQLVFGCLRLFAGFNDTFIVRQPRRKRIAWVE